jgi:hypothetical protein
MADIARPDFTVIRQRDRLEYSVLLWALAGLFLVVAVVGRLMPKAWRPFPNSGKSVIGEAREAANTLAPFAFMR